MGEDDLGQVDAFALAAEVQEAEDLAVEDRAFSMSVLP
jgi:hypothetical protein